MNSMRFAAVLMAVFVATTAYAQPSPPGPLDSAAREQAVRAAAGAIRAGYIFPEIGERAASDVEARLKAGAYDGAADGQAFAQAVTADLQSVTHDKHLRLMLQGARPPNLAPPPRNEGGVVRADRLDHGICYIEVVAFPPLEAMQAPLDRALSQLKDCKAVIVDDRRNGGGSPESVAYLVSHFLGRDAPILLNEFVNRTRGTNSFTTRQEMSFRTPLSFKGKRVLVLTSARTFSGGEEFAYDMQAFKLATLVGETTGGGANPGGVQPVGHGFLIFVPVGRPVNAVTKTNWEGVGVIPDVQVPAADALKVALQRLGERANTGDIDALSRAKAFQPRTVAQEGSRAAVLALLSRLAESRDAADLLTPGYLGALRSPLGQTQVADARRQVASLGAVRTVTFVEVDPQGFDRYRVQLSGGALDARILMSPAGKVAQFAISPAAS